MMLMILIYIQLWIKLNTIPNAVCLDENIFEKQLAY